MAGGKIGETILEDQVVFGDNAWVYCDQHMAAHTTGWCTVGAANKTLLVAQDYTQANIECRQRGFPLHIDREDR